jgi:hypothetical protein
MPHPEISPTGIYYIEETVVNPADIFHYLKPETPLTAKINNLIASNQLDEALRSLRDYLVNRESPELYAGKDRHALIAYLKTHFPREIAETLKIADEVVNQEFLFRGRWDMERTTQPVRFKSKIQWDAIPNEDEEWCFMFNRHKYWISLGQAYALTGDEKYAQTFFSQLEDWIDSNPLEERLYRKSWRTLEAGIRMENWVKALQLTMASPSFTPQLAGKLMLSMWQHGKYLYDNYNHFRRLSNWGVIENHGLFILTVFLPELKEADSWQKAALTRQEEEIQLQCLEDGTQWEQSPLYHNEVLRCYLDLINLAGKNNISISEAITSRARKMAYADLIMARPDHCEPLLGDSDEVDVRDVLSLSGYLFKDGQLKFGGYSSLDYESLWDTGYAAHQVYETITALEPAFTSKAMPDAGNYYLRSGWQDKDCYFSFRCGFHGGGHGHADNLHIDLSAYGDNILTDSGRFTYVEGNPWRDYFKASSAHNVPYVDNQEFADLAGSWQVKKAALPLNTQFKTNSAFDYVEGGHLGYFDLSDPVIVTRKVIYLKPSCWILMDEFHAKQSHQYSQLFHFGPGKVAKQGKNVLFEGKNARLKLLSLEPTVHVDIVESHLSRQYNMRESTQQAILSRKGEGFSTMGVLLWAEPLDTPAEISWSTVPVFRGNGNEAASHEAQAYKIKIADKEEFLIFFVYQEHAQRAPAPLWLVEDTPVFAKVALIRGTPAGKKVYPIRY